MKKPNFKEYTSKMAKRMWGYITKELIEKLWNMQGCTCVLCNKAIDPEARPKTYVIHHRVYRRSKYYKKWPAHPEDLMVLCKDCHRDCHQPFHPLPTLVEDELDEEYEARERQFRKFVDEGLMDRYKEYSGNGGGS